MSMVRGVARIVAGASICLGLGACSMLPWRDEPPAADDAPAAPAAAASSAAGATYHLEVDAPRDLRTLLVTYLDLARFEGAAQAEGITEGELNRLANASPAQAKTLLETEGYFAADVVVSRETAADGLPLIRLKVSPGPRATVSELDLKADGELQRLAEAGDKDALSLVERIKERWSLPPGEPFRQSTWNAAKNGALANLRSEGYPAAKWKATSAHVDARAHTAALSGEIDSGPRYLIGAIVIEGMSRYDEALVRNVAELPPGTPYSEKRLTEFQERLLKLNFFETVAVDIDPDPATAAAAPVRVRVREQNLQQATTGFGYSDATRFSVTLEHRHRRPFGWNGQVYNKIEYGSKKRLWEGELISNPDERGYRKLLATSFSWEDAASEISRNYRIRAGRSYDTQHIERLMYGEWLSSELTRANSVEESARALSANYNWVWRQVDNIILPTRGLTVSIETGAGYARSNYADSGGFVRLYTRDVLYWPLGGSWYTQLRVEAGQVFTGNSVGIPDPLLFRAGGDESVRGYAYRTLGPQRDGAVSSGRVLLTTSAELAHPISQKLENLWWAVFLDAGNAADTWHSYEPVLGYGLGIRYRSPVGPLRVDLAYGEEVQKFRIHLSVGIAF